MLEELSLAGVPPHVGFDYTPRDAAIVIKAAGRRAVLDIKAAVITAHYTASLSRSKRIPALNRLLKKLEPERARPMTTKELRAAIFAANAALGGTVRHAGSP
ncbi:hypothetical protein TVVG_00014 [Tetraselmis viridis virus SI1]|uniref:hypothetical protein n=1 Tax=Tetraselmis viridis virus S20 TaxID=754070 RepID=UPI0002C11E8F|nr:hypothetical protein TVGG_00035 [Tetraselmis viridis virus S20]AGH31363.1 hypothetical protein TVGG_00035 [Tetraselmis viridis virus S20]AGH31397.1 hypothetical protein TVVG_00014 [Tetraselmis viridis virus SI1]